MASECAIRSPNVSFSSVMLFGRPIIQKSSTQLSWESGSPRTHFSTGMTNCSTNPITSSHQIFDKLIYHTTSSQKQQEKSTNTDEHGLYESNNELTKLTCWQKKQNAEKSDILTRYRSISFISFTVIEVLLAAFNFSNHWPRNSSKW